MHRRGLGQCVSSIVYRVIVWNNALRRTGRLLTRAGKSSGFKLIHTYRISILNLTTAQETTTDQNAKLKLISQLLCVSLAICFVKHESEDHAMHTQMICICEKKEDKCAH